ncbi:hypothetical protein FRC10_006605, partial [Ceratobasidium sp. 414]
HIRLATVPARVNFQSHEHADFYDLMIQFCNDHNPLPNVAFYGFGRPPVGGVYIRPVGSTLSFPHFFRYGIRYGSADHRRGRKSRFAYIDNQIPVLIRRVYKVTVAVEGEDYVFLGVVVQHFVAPRQEPVFPWDYWDDFLSISAWRFNQFGPLEVVPAESFNGVFALADIEMPNEHYWITMSMIHTEPEGRVEDD